MFPLTNTVSVGFCGESRQNQIHVTEPKDAPLNRRYMGAKQKNRLRTWFVLTADCA